MTLNPEVKQEIEEIMEEKDVKITKNTGVPEAEIITPVLSPFTRTQFFIIALLALIAANALDDAPRKVNV